MFRSTFAVACALVIAAVQCAEISNQLRHYLDESLVATAKAGYTPSAFVIPGSELEVPDQSKFQADGFFSVSSGSEPTCTGSETVSVAANTCIVDGVFSYKLQLVKDSCAGASIQYFYDNVCSLYVGSSVMDASVEKCTQNSYDARRPVYTSLSCSIKTHRAYKKAQNVDLLAGVPTLEPTAEPTRTPTFRPTVAATFYPTAAEASTQSFTADQTINGITYTQYLANEAANEASIIAAIAGSMDGVTTDDIKDFTASGSSRRLESVSLRRLQGSSSIRVVYKVTATSLLTSSQLFSQLSNSVSTGNFDILLHNAAQSNGATDLLAAESVDVEYYDDDNNGNRLSDGAIAGIVVGVVFGVLLLALVIYMFAVGGGSSGGAAHKQAAPPTEL